MRRVNFERDIDAVVHFLMEWRDKLNGADGVYDEFAHTDLHMYGVEYRSERRTEARNDRVRAEDILRQRFEVSGNLLHRIETLADAAARHRHDLRRQLAFEIFLIYQARHGKDRALDMLIDSVGRK